MSVSKRRAWILTSVANGSCLMYDAFRLHGFDVDECHYTQDTAVVYTYVHFKKGISLSAMKHFLDKMKTSSGVVMFDIFGYDSVASSISDAELEDHVGFKILLAHYQGKHPAFRCCTDGQPVVTRGILWNGDTMPRIKEILVSRNKKLGLVFENIEKELHAAKQTAELVESLQQQLLECESQIEKLGHYKFVSYVLKYRITQLDPASQEMMLEPDHKGRPLFEW